MNLLKAWDAKLEVGSFFCLLKTFTGSVGLSCILLCSVTGKIFKQFRYIIISAAVFVLHHPVLLKLPNTRAPERSISR